MSKKYDAILFDFDFTLADASEGIEHCLRYGFEQMNLEFISPGMEKYTEGITLTELISRHSGNKDSKILEGIYSNYLVVAKEQMTNMTRFFDDTHDALLHLIKNDYRLGIVSNKYRFRIEEFLSKHNYLDLFEVIVGTEDVKEMKPAPEGLLLAMKRMNSKKENTLFIGDNPIDAMTAKNAGTDFIGISRYGHKHFENSDSDLIALIKTLDELKAHL
ncbi:MAG: HAD-IA family hydrolase [Ignavibacteriae bacterium]|nr:HAD-IA family hydrolase [Ignavibacteriota bacterium]MCB9244585.1 HAD-IA family hydrolase [Ignavibacteriales bacterium]